MKLLLIPLLALSGCAMETKNIRVVQSKSEITVKHLQVDDQDSLLCDPEGCRKLK